ncbi:MAG: energy transducer TonB [Gracilimonas sp.]|nr:energy transducer TonB [Gracilimonas sp.]
MKFIKPTYLLPVLLAILVISCSGPKVMIEYQGSSPYPPVNSASENLDGKKASNDSSEKTFAVISSFPEPEGGNRALRRKITYPEKAIENGIQGQVTVQFFIDETGKASNFEVIEGIGHGCDEAVISALEDTKFGLNGQDDVRFLWLVTVDFKL